MSVTWEEVGADCRVACGDALTVLPTLDDASVDAVVTDPPYAKEFEHLWQTLASESVRLLKDRGNLVTLLGQYQLPTVLEAFNNRLRYWWIGGMYHPGHRMRFFGKGVCIFWKPCLWFVKGKRRVDLPDVPMDMTQPRGNSKALHPWQQPLPWFEHWIDRLTLPGETVLDPFMGSGTTGVACIKTGRKFIGAEIDPAHFATALARLRACHGVGSLFDPGRTGVER